MKRQFTDVCFTLIPCTEELAKEVESRGRALHEQGELKYFVGQLEKSPTTEKVHFQGYCELSSKKTGTWIKNELLVESAHLENRRGTRFEAAIYCKKEDTRVSEPVEIGEPPKMTYAEKRMHKAEEARDMDTRVLLEIADRPYCALSDRPQWFRMWAASRMLLYQTYLSDARLRQYEERDVQVTVYWGPTATGKTRTAVDACAAVGAMPVFMITFKHGEKPWFDGYCGQSAIVFDEFDHNAVNCQAFKRLTDRYHYQPEVKGGHVAARWDKVFITSNTDPRTWWQNADAGDRDACMRRIKTVVHLTAPYKA